MSKKAKLELIVKNMTLEDDPSFKKLFWEWFDSLPQPEKEKFWSFKIDMATTYFFNAIYTKQLESNKAKVERV